MILGVLNRFADASLRKKYNTAVGDLATAESRPIVANTNYARANAALAECQRKAQQADETSKATYRAVKDRYEGLIASIKDAHTAAVDELEGRIGDLRVQLDLANESVTGLEHTAMELQAELEQESGRRATAEERLQLIDREEDMRDEVRAKRLSDGLGDD